MISHNSRYETKIDKLFLSIFLRILRLILLSEIKKRGYTRDILSKNYKDHYKESKWYKNFI